jgi:hypothetical protein
MRWLAFAITLLMLPAPSIAFWYYLQGNGFNSGALALLSLVFFSLAPALLAWTASCWLKAALLWFPQAAKPVPVLIVLHGFGGLLTPYISILASSELGKHYAIVAPALDMAGAWWEPEGKAVLKRTLERCLPGSIPLKPIWSEFPMERLELPILVPIPILGHGFGVWWPWSGWIH